MANRSIVEQHLGSIKEDSKEQLKVEFSQYGNTFQDTNAATTPPSGYVIVAISFLADITFTAMSAENNSGSKSFGLTGGETGEGSGGVVIDSSNIFPKGLTIYGRWTSVTPTADSDGGIICYFGK